MQTLARLAALLRPHRGKASMVAVYPEMYLDFILCDTSKYFLNEGALVPLQVFRNKRIRYADHEFVLFIPDAVRFR